MMELHGLLDVKPLDLLYSLYLYIFFLKISKYQELYNAVQYYCIADNNSVGMVFDMLSLKCCLNFSSQHDIIGWVISSPKVFKHNC